MHLHMGQHSCCKLSGMTAQAWIKVSSMHMLEAAWAKLDNCK